MLSIHRKWVILLLCCAGGGISCDGKREAPVTGAQQGSGNRNAEPALAAVAAAAGREVRLRLTTVQREVQMIGDFKRSVRRLTFVSETAFGRVQKDVPFSVVVRRQHPAALAQPGTWFRVELKAGEIFPEGREWTEALRQEYY